MSVIDSMRALKDRVKGHLERDPELKDNDLRLIANIWSREIVVADYTAHQFLEKFARGELSNQESIRRVRQKLQQDEPSLRGEKWRLRHAEAVEVRSEIRDL